MSRRTPPQRPVRRRDVQRVRAAAAGRSPKRTTTGSRSHGRSPAVTQRPASARRRDRPAATAATTTTTTKTTRTAQRRVVSRRSPVNVTRFQAGVPRRRLIVVLLVVLAALVAVLVRVGGIQTTRAEGLRDEGARQWTRTTNIPAGRGTIFDRNGEELAMSVPASTVSVNPRLVDDPVTTARMLQSVLGLSQERHDSLLADLVEARRGFVYVARQVDDSLGAQIASLRLSGVDVVREDRRILPGGDTGRSVIGRTDIDGVGSAGLELQFDELLTGHAGEMTREVAPGGRSIPGTESVALRPVPGDDLILTLDRSIQFACEEALIERVGDLEARGGTCIVMHTETGDVLAMASVRRSDETGSVEVTSGNFAAVDADEPGSVAKVITVAAALSEGLIEPNTGFEVPWREQYYDDLISDAWQHPDEWMTVSDILVSSSNIGTIKIWERLGRELHWNYMRAFGLGEPTALDFPGESAGLLKDWTDLWGSERVTVSYGQGMASTSIQLAAAVNVVANDGIYVAPRLVRGTVGPTGETTEMSPSATHSVVSAEAARQTRQMLADSVCRGTATQAQVEGFNVGGKTGTGLKAQPNGTYLDEQGRRVYYASFVGFFPAEDPEVTLLVSVDEPPADSGDRFGGRAAGPVFRSLVPTIVHELGIRPPTGSAGCVDGG